MYIFVWVVHQPSHTIWLCPPEAPTSCLAAKPHYLSLLSQISSNFSSSHSSPSIFVFKKLLSKVSSSQAPLLLSFSSQSSSELSSSQDPQTFLFFAKVKVKESRNRPGVAQRVPGGLGSQISWHSAHEGGEVVSLTHRQLYPQEMFLVLIFTRGWVDPRAMVWSEGMCHWKIQWHHWESIPGPSD